MKQRLRIRLFVANCEFLCAIREVPYMRIPKFIEEAENVWKWDGYLMISDNPTFIRYDLSSEEERIEYQLRNLERAVRV